MGDNVLSRAVFSRVASSASGGGAHSVTRAAEERSRAGQGLDPMVDPKGLPHLGPVRLSLPRFERIGDYWRLTRGIPMPIETLLDTTGSMGDNVEKAFEALPHDYDMLTSGDTPLLGRYDVQIASAIFNDTQDGTLTSHVLGRSQFEMAEKIALQLTMLPPGKGGCGNGKEDPQFGLFAAAYLTNAAINRWGLKGYHFTVSDEPLVEQINVTWLRRIFGDDVIERVKTNGFDFTKKLPDVKKVVQDLQARAHAFFLQVDDRPDVTQQWTRLYDVEHVVMLPHGTEDLHVVKSVIIGLTEGVLDLAGAKTFMTSHGVREAEANRIIRTVAHIPIGAQTHAKNFDRIPKAGDLFREKTDLWPVNPEEVSILGEGEPQGAAAGPGWL